MQSLIEAADLPKITDNQLILIDASGTPGSRETYLNQHPVGALYVDLNHDLSDIKDNAAEGGRHPLPTIGDFAELLTQLGITPEHHVVIYDHMYGANAAARMWWMLKAIGHEKVQVVNGGFEAIQNEGMEMTSGPEKAAPAKDAYPARGWQLPIVVLDELINISQHSSQTIIDVRESKRYHGESEPIDLIAGHIPNAINVPFQDNLTKSGKFKSSDELKSLYSAQKDQLDNGRVIVHCGSGVTACHTILAMDHAGLPLPTLYVGSWSEWSRNDLPMITQH